MKPLRQWLADRAALSADSEFTVEAGAESTGPPAALRLQDDIETALAKCRAEAAAAHQHLLEEAIEAARVDCADQLAAARRQWSEHEAERLSSSFEEAFATLHETLAASVARALQVFLEGEAQGRAVESFHAALDKLGQSHKLIQLEGPADLIAALGPLPDGVMAEESEKAQLRAVAGETEVESDFVRWAATLRGDAA